MGWTAPMQMFQHMTLSDHIQVLAEACKYLTVNHWDMVGEFLLQSLAFLKSPQSFLREAAASFIGLTIKRMSLIHVQEEDVELLISSLRALNNDPVATVRAVAVAALRNVDVAAACPRWLSPGFGASATASSKVPACIRIPRSGSSKATSPGSPLIGSAAVS
ncbi:maestro heat-like repeat-containing protein family member 6 [Ornithorhynchus anatinus]|uniref:maestro heat-like repeat-containing protein family member 6 n=1 Tax=Ornithorhynchus anatinus TaxID=9258 RepID=UPI0010A92FCA|nr:maestro heat-like repeat-containing protein family member 6 [Ornithorhynchus anatinus]